MKNVKTFSQFIIAGFTIMVLIIILRSLMNSPTGLSIRQAYSKEAENLAAENAVKIQQQKDRAVWMRWKAEEMKARVASEASLQKIKSLPDKALRWSAFWWGAVVSSILFMALTSILLAISAYKLSRAHSELIALTILGLRGRSKEELMTARETMKLEEARLKYLDQHPELIISAQEPIAIDTQSVSIPTAAQCLQDGLFTREGNRFLWGFDEQSQPVFGDLVAGESDVAIIGEKQLGKTWNAVNIAIQYFYKGSQGIVIDLHGKGDKSIGKYLSAWQEKASIMWAFTRDEVVKTLHFVADMIEQRTSSQGPHTPCIVLVDECLELASSYPEEFNESLRRVVTEGAKANMIFVGVSHTWKTTKTNSELRDMIKCQISHQSKPSQSRLLFGDKELAAETSGLQKGEFILKDESLDTYRLKVPHWDSATIERMATQAIDAPAIQPQEAFALPDLREYKGFHIVDGGKTA